MPCFFDFLFNTFSGQSVLGIRFIKTVKVAEDDVMSLIDVIFKNTKSDNIESTSGDPFWGATRSVLKRYCTNN